MFEIALKKVSAIQKLYLILDKKMKKVNLFIIGAMKSGTTTLHDYLSEHPEIFMSQDKEPGFFVDKIWKNRPRDDYEKLFHRATNEKYLGESSTHYTKLPTFPGVAEKIYQYNPSAKILYIVRHPIERAISHYYHNRRDLLFSAEKRSIYRAFTEDNTYMAYSNYAMQIEPYLKLFGSNNLLIIVFENIISGSANDLFKIFNWLNIEKPQNLILTKKSNIAPERFNVVRGFGFLNKLRYSSLWGVISPYVPKKTRQFGNLLSEKKEVKRINKKDKNKIYHEFKPVFQEYIHNLEKLTGESYPLWTL